MSEITIFTARHVHTMSDSQPAATAIAVRDGRILEAGTPESLRPWTDKFDVTVDDRFKDKVIMPGFIDPHLHPSLGAVLLPSYFLTAFDWNLPDRQVSATRGRDAYLAGLKEAFEREGRNQEIFITWGYHQQWHGEVGRAELNEISGDHPIIIWHRSFHEVIANDAAIDRMGIERSVLERHPQINLETGRFSETGSKLAVAQIRDFLFGDSRFIQGLQKVMQVVHRGGHTTVGDMCFGIFDVEQEWAAYKMMFDHAGIPLRIMMVPRGRPPENADDDTIVELARLEERETEKLRFDKRVKLFTDGAMFSELMQLNEPGFIDGHHGEWLMVPEDFEAAARTYWHAGYRIHVHCTGDLGLELALDTLEKLQWEKPRFNHGFTIEHFGVSTEEQVRRIKVLGALVCANPYYIHELGEAYWTGSIGHERASQMVRLGSVARAGIPFGLHSDFTMAPAEPLRNAWVAVNRLSETGKVLAPPERVSVHQAMRAITIDAALMIGMENEIGSIRSGKRADFTVLDDDPYQVAPETLKDVGVHATVFEGQVFGIER